MNRLSQEFLERLAIEKKPSFKQINKQVDDELKALVEEIIRKYSQ